ncbi:hypothetical protein ANN_13996 [Periplaneta americana]|uniref:Uncharacterized protein n=1 Tax=Periplaneta americana TaxID=6978 RepID=A0ABQ8SV58_PERAM|nr:hypothetical protein ANN_13996 [Periplaneta americana]
MSVEEFLVSACGRKNLNAMEHFVRVKKRRDMEDHNYFVPHRTDLIETYVGRTGPIRCPPRSPDLTPLDFFFWGFIKDRVYATKPRIIPELVERIEHTIQVVTPDMLTRVHEELIRRLHLSESLIKKIRREGVCAGDEKIESPGKNRPREPLILVDMNRCILRGKIQEFYTVQKEVPTLKKLLKVAKEAIISKVGEKRYGK